MCSQIGFIALQPTPKSLPTHPCRPCQFYFAICFHPCYIQLIWDNFCFIYSLSLAVLASEMLLISVVCVVGFLSSLSLLIVHFARIFACVLMYPPSVLFPAVVRGYSRLSHLFTNPPLVLPTFSYFVGLCPTMTDFNPQRPCGFVVSLHPLSKRKCEIHNWCGSSVG